MMIEVTGTTGRDPAPAGNGLLFGCMTAAFTARPRCSVSTD